MMLGLFLSAASPVISIFFICLSGAYLKRTGMLDKEACLKISKLVFWIFTPALNFSKLSQSVDLKALTLCIMLGLCVGYVVSIIAGVPKSFRKPFMCTTAMGNMGNVPIALLTNLCNNPTSIFQKAVPGAACIQKGVSYIAFTMWIASLFHLFVAFRCFAPEETDKRAENAAKAKISDADLHAPPLDDDEACPSGNISMLSKSHHAVDDDLEDSTVGVSVDVTKHIVSLGECIEVDEESIGHSPGKRDVKMKSKFDGHAVNKGQGRSQVEADDKGEGEGGDGWDQEINSCRSAELESRAMSGLSTPSADRQQLLPRGHQQSNTYPTNPNPSQLLSHAHSQELPGESQMLSQDANNYTEKANRLLSMKEKNSRLHLLLHRVKSNASLTYIQKTIMKIDVQSFLNTFTISIILGLIIGCTPFLRHIYLGNYFIISSFKQSIDLLGDAMIPCILLALGANLSEGPKSSRIPVRAVVASVAARTLIMPALGFIVVIGLKNYHSSPDILFTLVNMLTWSTPMAVNLQMVASIQRNWEEETGTLIFYHYVAAVFTLPIWMTIYMRAIA